MKLTREQQRNKRAEDVCRELRFQLANDRGWQLSDTDKILRLLTHWMKVAKSNKYTRP